MTLNGDDRHLEIFLFEQKAEPNGEIAQHWQVLQKLVEGTPQTEHVWTTFEEA